MEQNGKSHQLDLMDDKKIRKGTKNKMVTEWWNTTIKQKFIIALGRNFSRRKYVIRVVIDTVKSVDGW